MRTPSASVTIRRWSTLVAVALATTIGGCSAERTVAPDTVAPSSVADAPRAGLLSGTTSLVTSTVSGLVEKVALSWSRPLSSPVSTTFVVSNAGGTFELPETGLRLTVPSGALGRPTMSITVTALAGRGVAYSFEPHGVQFHKPLLFSQSLAPTTWSRSPLAMLLGGGYFKDDSQVDARSGKVLLDELLRATVRQNRVEFEIEHFSGYMVSTD